MATTHDNAGQPATVPAWENEAPGLREILVALRENVGLLAVSCLVGLLCGIAIILRSTPLFESRAIIQVEQSGKRVVKIEEVAPTDLESLELLRTIEQSLRTPALLTRVVEKMDLAKNEHFAGKMAGKPEGREIAVAKLMEYVDAELRKGTRLIDLRVESPAPKQAQTLAKKVIEEYLAMTLEQRLKDMQFAHAFLIEQSEKLRKKLQDSERALQTYKEKSSSISLEERQDIVGQKLKELNLRYTAANAERVRLESDWKMSQKIKNNPEALLAIPSVAQSAEVNELRKAISEQKAELANLRKRYLEKHPKLIGAMSQLQQTEEILQKTALEAPGRLEQAYENAKGVEESLLAALREQEKAALELGETSLGYDAIQREVASDRALYESILTRLKETGVAQGIEDSPIRVIQEPSLPSKPSKPQKLLILLLSTICGIAVGFLLLILLKSLDSSLKSVEETEAALGTEVIASIPKHTAGGALPVLHAPHTETAEAFRTLRTSIAFRQGDGCRLLMVTSSIPGEGKTFVAVNLAISFAQQGLKTLLVEGDLRRPRLAISLELGNEEPGVEHALQGTVPTSDCVVETKVHGLFAIVSSGVLLKNPSELLATGAFQRMLTPVKEAFDRVVIDTPPLHAVSDAVLLYPLADICLLVVRSGKSPRQIIRRALRQLSNGGAAVVGIVLNALASRGAGVYSRHYSAKQYAGGYATREK
jgi:capsular exopolysaccharide synthesis family protein